MSKGIKPGDLSEAIDRELTEYSAGVVERLNAAGKKAMARLVKITKAAAPKGKRGDFRKSITSSEMDARNGNKIFVWHVKAPNHRLTHLLVHGHATKDGGRTRGNPFLQKALDQVLPEYEKDVEEAVKND